MSFDVSALSGEVPVPFWGSILTEEERTRRKDQVTETFVQACVYYMEQCAENSLHTEMLLDYAANVHVTTGRWGSDRSFGNLCGKCGTERVSSSILCFR